MVIEIDERGHIIHYQASVKEDSFTNAADCMEYAKAIHPKHPTVKRSTMIRGFPTFINWEKTKDDPHNPIFYSKEEVFDSWRVANENRFKKEKAE